ncbi:MAG: hypothetical protein NTY17_08435 [Planctomycetia bacterium]|nr:hypothetical protein [Planctomycetia bacterium]
MRSAQTQSTAPTRSHRPRAITVFAAAFIAGAAAAVGVNRALDVRLAQSKPRVESEAIFVALRSLPQGAPVTVWDVALRDWPKAMMPASALRASDTFSGHVLKHPLREGQPLLSIQLAPTGQGAQPAAEPTTFPPPAAYTNASTPVVPRAEGDLWSPAEPVAAQATPSTQQLAPTAVSPAISPVAVQPVEATPPTTSIGIAPSIEPSLAAVPAATPTQLPAQDTVSPQEPSAPTEPAPIEPTATVAAADGPAMATDTTEAEPATELASAPSTVPQPQAGPEGTTAADAAPPPAPLAAVPPTPPAPVNIPRPTHLRYLVVPESIATQADASFAARPAAPEQPVAEPTQTAPQTASRSGSNAVRPLPSTTTADRSGQGRPSQRGTQGKTPQRQGRQAQPASPGTPGNAAPQPRLGAVMFSNLSAGISAIDGQIRGGQPAPAPAAGQGQGPIAAQARPLTVR